MGSLDEVEFCLQRPALVPDLLVMGGGRLLLELDDYVYRGASLAAFKGVKIFGQLVALAVCKGQSGSQQGDQGQESKAPTPSRCR